MTSKGKVLVVDDERGNVMTIAACLRGLGYEVLEAPGSLEALRTLGMTPVDLVLSNVMMPGVDGIELVRRVRNHSELTGLPIVLMIALDGNAERARALSAGADDFLTKPIDPIELELRVRSQVRLRRLAQELDHRAQILGNARPPPERPSSRGRVFVMDGDAAWSAVQCMRLSAAGYTVYSAKRLETGIPAALEAAPDVVLVDLLLPDGSGTEFIRRLRHMTAAEPGRQMPVVLVTTSLEDSAERLNCLRHGADDYLTKPIGAEELLARIAAQVRRVRASRTAQVHVAQAQKAAHTDGLTGLYNRRFFDEDLAHRVKRAERGHNGFSIALLDLDHFKRINDTWGHAAGDEALCAMARVLLGGARDSDLVCRVGGDELILVLPGTPLADACTALDRLRLSIAELECAPLPRGAVTISAGIAAWGPNDEPAQLLARADRALYQAKRNGRNRVEICSTEGAT